MESGIFKTQKLSLLTTHALTMTLFSEESSRGVEAKAGHQFFIPIAGSIAAAFCCGDDAGKAEATMTWTTVQVQGLYATLSILAIMASYRLSLAFSSQTTFITRRNIHRSNNISRQLSTLEMFASSIVDINHHETLQSFNPLGPNPNLSNLSTGESLQLHDKQITRLSSSPDIFLVRDLIQTEDRKILMKAATLQGMKIAGTRSSGENTVRKNSYLAWIDPHSILCSNDDDEGGNYWKDASSVARETIAKSRLCFVHDVMNDLINAVEKMEFCFAEDLQVAKYDEQGMFDYHHDGYSRYLTVLTYLNGVGGTYFPFGNMGDEELLGINFTNETEVSVLKFKKNLDKCGILIVGEEGSNPYLKSSSFVKPKNIIHIKAGDAIAFYNYMPGGEKDLRQLHCSLPVPREKWISTSWFRSEALTGPFAALKKMQLFQESSSLCGADTRSVG
jgi:hypothetical protein